MEQQYDFGMIGLGVMGSNLLLNMADHGFAAIGFDLKPERGAALEAAVQEGEIVKAVSSLEELALRLKTPRKIMMLVPAGKPVDDVIKRLLPHLEKGDIVIDGGNSYYKDTLQRVAYLQDKGLHFFGMGVSGGEAGARFGPSLMPGGDKAAYEYLKPILESIAAEAGGKPCVAYMGNGAAGHYVKMVHNGIEYALMQMISEVYDLLRRGAGMTNEELYLVFSQWNKGSLQSFLIEVTAEIFRTQDADTEIKTDYLIDKILDKGGAKGTGRWTSEEGLNLAIAIPSIDAAVSMRNLSAFKDWRIAAAKIYQPKVELLAVSKEELIGIVESALFSGFIIAYAQGLSLLQQATADLEMNTSLPAVIQVWKGGCIIRSALLEKFEKAFINEPALSHLLLSKEVAALQREAAPHLRRVVALGVGASIPVMALSSALTYFDAFCSERLPMNLVQAQRDFFGAHTYQRIDKEGAFHTDWSGNSQ